MFYYEDGRRYSSAEKAELKRKGFYVYEIRQGDNFNTIEPSVWVNHIGSVITLQPIKFDKYGVVDYNKFCEHNENYYEYFKGV